MEVYLGTICAFAFGIIPNDWAQCNGQSLNVSQFGNLYSLIKTNFGGDGTSTFKLPDLGGKVAIGVNKGIYDIGATGGNNKVTLNNDTMPAHSHDVMVSIKATTKPPSTADPKGAYPTTVQEGNIYIDTLETGSKFKFIPTVQLAPVGSTSPIDITKPYLAMNYCMCMSGEYPKRS